MIQIVMTDNNLNILINYRFILEYKINTFLLLYLTVIEIRWEVYKYV